MNTELHDANEAVDLPDVNPGSTCYTKRLYWNKRGPAPYVWSGEQRNCVIRKAIKSRRCYDCGGIIPEDSLHAVEDMPYGAGYHYCLGCVTSTKEPERTVTKQDELPPDAFTVGPRNHTSEIAACYETAGKEETCRTTQLLSQPKP